MRLVRIIAVHFKVMMVYGVLLFLSCSSPTEGIAPPLYTFNYSNYLRTDGVAFWAMTAGDITNIGSRDIKIRPYLELYFSKDAYDRRVPDIKAIGAIGILDKTVDNGLIEKRDRIRPEETLQHFTMTEKFVPPASSSTILHRVTFEPL
ncbi:MAG: hypothetical protein HY562_01645 [Ignavibacteriales bacterium]|nr:hypothetical protein [Ignavibacteriales bacterium]